MNEQNKCPVMHGGIKHTTFGVRSNRDWWPKQLNLKILHQTSALSNPMGPASTMQRRSRPLIWKSFARTFSR